MLMVAVDATGKYAINGAQTPFGSTQSFAQALREAAKGAKEPVVAISADAAATHQSVINVMESARLAGYNHISFTTQTNMRTLSAGLLYMVGQYEVQWGPLSAGVILSTVPVAVLFTFLQRHLIHGLTAGAVKG